MAQHFKVLDVVKDLDELEELQAFARQPSRTIDQIWEWLQAKGYRISRGAVGNWKREFDVTDRYRASIEMARVVGDVAKGGGAAAISEAANVQLSQMLFERLLNLQASGQIETKELWAASMAIKNTVASKRGIEKLREEMAAALAEGEQEAKAGKSAVDVVDVIKRAMGITQS